jgi:nucleoside 2-deoxyribosyltransferase
MLKAYLAGPDVFLTDAAAHAARKVAICARYGIEGRPPINEDPADPAHDTAGQTWTTIYDTDIAMMEACDIIIANLTPFAGASADAGTLIEVGWFLGRGKSIFGYSNSRVPFAQRMAAQWKLAPPLPQTIAVESFDLPDNLMIPGAVQSGGCPIFVPADDRLRGIDALDIFETCVAAAAKHRVTAG